MRVVFGTCEFDTSQHVLLRHGRITALSLKAFQLLEILLDRRPDAVSKTEFLDLLWPQTAVSDASLHNLVAEVRAAIGDTSRAPRFIRTVPRFGYAFHGDARPVTAGDPDALRVAVGPRLFSKHAEWSLAEGQNVVGRDRDCAVSVDSQSVSRHHARITVNSREATVEDLGSKNGTYVDGQRVEHPVALREGSEMRVGTVTMTYRFVEAASSTQTQA